MSHPPALRFTQAASFRISSEPISAYPELPQQCAESAKEEKQTQGYEKNGERENEI